jgi:hypothetical protein
VISFHNPSPKPFQQDKGSITPLGIFGIVFTVGLTLVLSNATAILNQQRLLESVAQGFALALAGDSNAEIASGQSLTQEANAQLSELFTVNAELSHRLSQAKVAYAHRRIDGSVALKICQPPRVMVLNQTLSVDFSAQVCASAAAIQK